jgi:hypothetical protein
MLGSAVTLTGTLPLFVSFTQRVSVSPGIRFRTLSSRPLEGACVRPNVADWRSEVLLLVSLKAENTPNDTKLPTAARTAAEAASFLGVDMRRRAPSSRANYTKPGIWEVTTICHRFAIERSSSLRSRR